MSTPESEPSLREIVDALVVAYDGDHALAARWLGTFNWDLDLLDRPINLCATDGGRVRVYRAVVQMTYDKAKP
jgi:hypothetical protein